MALFLETKPNSPASLHTTTSTLTITVVSTIEAWMKLSEKWQDLLVAAGIENISLSHEWLSGILKHFAPRQLLIILVWNEAGDLVAAAPFCINYGKIRLFQRLLRHIQFLGSETYLYDAMEIPIDRRYDESRVLDTIGRYLQDIRQQWDLLDLQACSKQKQLTLLFNRLQPKQTHCELTLGEAMPFLPLPVDTAAYEQDRSKKRVHRDVKRFHRKLEAATGLQAELIYLDSSPDSMRHLDNFFELHTHYWLARTGKSSFKNHPQLSTFYKEILAAASKQADTPCFCFSVLKAGDIVLSYQLGVWYGWGYMNYMNCYNPDYKEYRAGILHIDAVIRDTIDKKGAEYSFGQGEESYKSLWADSKQPLYNGILFKNTAARTLYKLDSVLKRFKSNSTNES